MLTINKKGQTSIEMMLITVIVLVASSLIIANTFSAEKETAAVALIKEMMLKELAGQDDFYYIQKIEGPIHQNDSVIFNILIEPKSGLPNLPIDNIATDIEKKVNDVNLFKDTVTINIQ